MCSACATSSLPVPLSPVISAVEDEADTESGDPDQEQRAEHHRDQPAAQRVVGGNPPPKAREVAVDELAGDLQQFAIQEQGLGADVAEATGGVELPALPGFSFPGRKASMRKSVMAKPVCSSGASDKSRRLVMLI